MSTRRALRLARVAFPLCLTLAALGLSRAEAQQNPPVRAPDQSGLHTAWLPPEGDWLRVLTVTDRWLVLENEIGQQFPVAFDAIDLFVMRWPATLDRIGPNDLIEATGIDLGTNRVAVDHIDIFKGPAQALVTPALQRIIGFNRVVTLFDAERQNVLGLNFQYMLTPEEWFLPWRYHVVASPASTVPLQLAIGGNINLELVPGPSGLDMTEVTQGVPSFVRPGDVAYVVPLLEATTPRSVALSQLVIYKFVGIDAFRR